MIEISVIIPFRNMTDSLRHCLQCLKRQTYPSENFEIIAVDNDSSEELDPIKREFSRVRWLTESGPSSYAARNCGVRHAQGEIIAFTDADCLPAPNWLFEAAQALRTSDATIIGGKIELLNPPARSLNSYELFEAKMFDMANQRRVVEQLGFAVTANLVTYRRTFEKVGLFDSSLKSSGDREWVQRAVGHGESLLYRDSVLVHHPRRSSFIDVSRKIRRLKGGRIALARKRKSRAEMMRAAVTFSLLDLRLYRLLGVKRVGVIDRIRLWTIAFAMGLIGTLETARVLLGGEPSRGSR
jgi:glycosyltransferase involved in cell wall biosynthesis